MIDIEKTRAARAVIAAGWCQTADARDATGLPVSVGSKDAACHCTAGGLMAAGLSTDIGSPELLAIARKISPELIDEEYAIDTVTEWNDEDDRTQAEVLAILDSVIDDAVQAVRS